MCNSLVVFALSSSPCSKVEFATIRRWLTADRLTRWDCSQIWCVWWMAMPGEQAQKEIPFLRSLVLHLLSYGTISKPLAPRCPWTASRLFKVCKSACPSTHFSTDNRICEPCCLAKCDCVNFSCVLQGLLSEISKWSSSRHFAFK